MVGRSGQTLKNTRQNCLSGQLTSVYFSYNGGIDKQNRSSRIPLRTGPKV